MSVHSRRRAAGLSLVLSLLVASVVASAAYAAYRGTNGSAVSLTTRSGAAALTNPKLPPSPTDVAGANVRGAQEFLLANMGTPKFVAPGPAFDMHKVKKAVWWIAFPATFPVEGPDAQGFLSAAHAAGVPAHVCQGFATPQGVATCIQQAIQAHAGSVVLSAQDPRTIVKPLQQAHQAGIKVVEWTDQPKAGLPLPEGIDGSVTYDYSGTGALGGAYAVATWGAATDAICITTPEILVTKAVCDGFTAAVKKYCPSCKVITKSVPYASLVSGSAAVVNAAALADPHLNFVEGWADTICGWAGPSLKSLGKSPSQVRCGGQNGDLASLGNTRSGGYEYIDVGQDATWAGWAMFDGGARIQVQAMPKSVNGPGLTVFTREYFPYKGPISYAHLPQLYQIPLSYLENHYKQQWGLG